MRQFDMLFSKKMDIKIVAYYLSEYGYNGIFPGKLTQIAAIAQAARILGIPTNTLKNERDYFDPHTNSTREGWWQVPITNERKEIIENMRFLSKDVVLAKVKNILNQACSTQCALIQVGLEQVNQ